MRELAGALIALWNGALPGSASAQVGKPFDLQGHMDRAVKTGSKRAIKPPGRYRVTQRGGVHLRLTGLMDVTIVADGVEMICTLSIVTPLPSTAAHGWRHLAERSDRCEEPVHRQRFHACGAHMEHSRPHRMFGHAPVTVGYLRTRLGLELRDRVVTRTVGNVRRHRGA
ncbi:MAG: hypothetical protein FJX72_08660 [Armatimonadetes bacterium]|nr:hypothetical protein [Armatimonadota bacterium]